MNNMRSILRTDTLAYILEDEILDRAIPGAITNAGKKRVEVEAILLQEHILIIDSIITAAINYWISMIQKEREIIEEILNEEHEKLLNNLNSQTTKYFHELETYWKKIKGELEQIIEILQDQLEYLNYQHEQVIQEINNINTRIIVIDKELTQIDDQRNAIYLDNITRLSEIKHDNLIISSLILPEEKSHPVDNDFSSMEIDVNKFIANIRKHIHLNQIKNVGEISSVTSSLLKFEASNHVKQNRNIEETEKNIEIFANSSVFMKAVTHFLNIITNNLTSEDKTKIISLNDKEDELKSEKILLHAKGNHLEIKKMKLSEKIEKKSSEIQDMILYHKNIEKHLNKNFKNDSIKFFNANSANRQIPKTSIPNNSNYKSSLGSKSTKKKVDLTELDDIFGNDDAPKVPNGNHKR